jgi:hypothetical protein
MEIKDDELRPKNPRPVCFGDEAKFVAHMENPATDSECGRCSSEDEYGEFILFKCSLESIF